MYAELKYFGLTGLAYIELAGGSKDAPPLKKKDSDIPVIREKPSLYNRLDTTLTDMTAKVTIALDKIDKLLSDQNIKNMSKTIENTKEITENIKNSNQDISKAIKNFVEIEENINILTKNLKNTSTKIASSSDAFKDMSDSIKTIAKKQIDDLIGEISGISKKTNTLLSDIIKGVKGGDYNIKKISSSTVSQINQAIEELRMLLKTSQDVIEEIERSPSDLLYKKEQPLLGPGEKTK
jgi:phospholipid/cholesterol/gamma-HCH transport system substrate-binding protein